MVRLKEQPTMKNLLGGKGANLAEMNLIGVPVPPGFTITTDTCTLYNQLGKEKVIELIKSPGTEDAMKYVEGIMKMALARKTIHY
jgi:pyruvate, orthophosphate dikinase